MMTSTTFESDPAEKLRAKLLTNIQSQLPTLEALFEKVSSHRSVEDRFYRFYHQSFKVYYLQEYTQEIVTVLGELLPGRALNADFLQIIGEGTGSTFNAESNTRWLEETRPILEAFFHARMMLQFAVLSGRQFTTLPLHIPSGGWGSLLYLYNLR